MKHSHCCKCARGRPGRSARLLFDFHRSAQATTDPGVRAFLAASIGGTDAFLSDLIAKARDRGEVPSNADPAALAQLATATLHTIAVRSRVGVSRKQLVALAVAAIDLICGPENK
jgi:hypothetical protein